MEDAEVEAADDEEQAAADAAAIGINVSLLSSTLFDSFDAHEATLRSARTKKRKSLEFLSAAEDDSAAATKGGGEADIDVLEGLGVRLPEDKWQGDTNMRCLNALLRRVDMRGFERSSQQLEFHESFKKAAARIIYRADWATEKPAIMKKYNWDKVNGEVLISTPRRFGKTFSIVRVPLSIEAVHVSKSTVPTQAIFCACLALSFGHEIVVFSPARRASRKLLERIVE